MTLFFLCFLSITGFDIRVGSLGKTETDFRLPRQNSSTLVNFLIKKTIHRDRIQDPHQTTEAEFLAYVEPCNKEQACNNQ